MSGVKSPSSLQALTSFDCHMKQSLPNVWVGASSKEMRIKATPTVLGKNLNELYSAGGNGPTYYLLLILCESFLFEVKVYTCIHWYSCFCVARFILWFIVFVSLSNPPLSEPWKWFSNNSLPLFLLQGLYGTVCNSRKAVIFGCKG